MKSAAIEIRRASVKDAESISALASELTARHIARDFTAEGRKTILDAMTREKITQYLEEGYRYHVAVFDGRVIGAVAMRDSRHLYHLFVHEDFQRQGIATRLWEVARDRSLAAGNPGLFTVNASLNAVPVYEKLGFIATSSSQETNGVIAVPMRLNLDR